VAEVFRFDTEFQRKIIKLALDDDAFCQQVSRHVQAEHFESDALRWAWQQVQRELSSGNAPTLMVLRNRVRDVNPVLQPRYQALITAIEQDVIREEAFIRRTLAEWVQRAVFVGAFQESRRLFNMGQVDQAVTLMRQETTKAARVTFEAPDREFFFEEFLDRQRVRRRIAKQEWDYTHPTGIVAVDQVLDGGLSRGELGVWIADSKGGKSLFLVHLAAFTSRTTQKPVLFIVLEGSRFQVSNRIESLISRTLYRDVKRGDIDPATFRELMEEYAQLKGLLVVRGMADSWSYTVADIRAELEELKALKGWRPDQIVVDYGDLLRSQQKGVSEEQHQRDAFGDLKVLSTQDRGYSVWTASQARRPWSGKKEIPKDSIIWGKPVLKPRDVADSYNKVRRADFIGSINQDKEDKAKKMARLWLAMYRDNPAEVYCEVKQDLDRMVFADLLDKSNRPDRPEAIAEREQEKKMKAANPNLKVVD